MGSYVPNTLEERQEMLKEIGYSSIEDLFAHIQTFYSIHSEECDFKRKSADSIYTVSGRDQSGNLTVHFRVSDNDL